MFLPQFSLRRVLGGVTAWACFFLLGGLALRGQAWALGIVVALTSLMVVGLFHALFYLLVAFTGRILGFETIRVRTSRGNIVTGNDPGGDSWGADHEPSLHDDSPSFPPDSLP